MPSQLDQIESLFHEMLANPAIDPQERARREVILHDITTRIQENGPRVAQPDPSRAHQFMPFAALKGYHEMAHNQERVREEKHIMTEERATKLSEAIARLKKGAMVTVVHYERDHYATTCGILTEVDEAFRTLRVVKTKIAFDNIFSIESIQ